MKARSGQAYPRPRKSAIPLLRVLALALTFVLVAAAAALLAPPRARAAIFTVTSAADSGPGSLRDAITAANLAPGADTINFSIGGGGLQTITPLSALPAITDAVTIDGTTQPGYAGSPLIELNGSSAGLAHGLSFVAGSNGSTVIALDINRFGGAGVSIKSTNSVIVVRSYLGTDPSGAVAAGNAFGVLIVSAGPNRIGGPGAAARNIISGNTAVGVAITGNSPSNEVLGNYIGTDVGGAAPLGNTQDGVLVVTAEDNRIGDASGGGNVISGNGTNGVEFDDTQAIGIPGNTVRGNFIGTDAGGGVALPNGASGVRIAPRSAGGHANDNTVGGSTATSRNVISGNALNGVTIDGSLGAATNNPVLGNYIGTSAGGASAIPNAAAGVAVVTATGDIIGAGFGNLISGNTGPGVLLDAGASNDTVVSNYIGTQGDLVSPLGNGGDGVQVRNSSGNNIGTVAGGPNVIAFNAANGVEVTGGASNGIRTNSIYQNAANGILLGPGANNVPPEAPPLVMTAITGAFTTVTGQLVSSPSTAFAIEIFDSPGCGPGNGQGKQYLGSVGVVTNAVGFAAFVGIFPPTLIGSVITSTATDPAGNTSQFSNCRTVAGSGSDGDGDGCPDAQESLLSPATDRMNPWDFFSVPVPALFAAPNPLADFRDNVVSASDAQAVFAYFKAGAKVGRPVYDQDLNNNAIPDGIEYDRTVVGPGQSGTPDGNVTAQDAQLAFAQFKKNYHCNLPLATEYSCVYASDGLPTSTIQVACSAMAASAPQVYGWGTTLNATPMAAHCVQNFAGWSFYFYPGLEVGCADPGFAAVAFTPGRTSCATITNIYMIAPGGPAINVDLYTGGKIPLGSLAVPSTTFPIPGC